MDDPLSGLRDVHLPGAGFPELLAAAAAGLALAVICGLLLRFVAWRPPTRKQKLMEYIAALKSLDPGERLLGYANIAKSVDPGLVPRLRPALYARSEPVTADDAERDLLAGRRGAKLMFSFAVPYAFLLLPLPWFAARYLLPRAAAQGALQIPESVAARLPPDDAGALGTAARSFLPWLIWLALVIAFAGPRMAIESPALPASGRDIVLALDLSGSMEKIDFDLDGKPAKRIDVVKRASSAFVRSRGGDRIGLVIFAEKAYFAAAPTFDVEAVARAIEESVIGISGKSTAISDGLGLALKRLADSKAASRVVILLSDGVNNGGSVRPSDAAALAKKLGVRVHTIAMGKRDLETDKTDPDVVDTAALRLIATASGGTAFRVRATADFDAVSKSINEMEASAVEVPTAFVFYDYWIWPAFLAFAGAMALLVGQRRLA